jgi:hypothetical protein
VRDEKKIRDKFAACRELFEEFNEGCLAMSNQRSNVLSRSKFSIETKLFYLVLHIFVPKFFFLVGFQNFLRKLKVLFCLSETQSHFEAFLFCLDIIF